MPISSNDRDAAIRTIIGESGNQSPDGQAAVAHVILNRVNSGNFGGNSVSSVVHAPGQFDSWRQQGHALLGISPNSPQYQSIGKIVDGVVSGATPDKTGGATYFLNPSLVPNKPKWAQGDGVQIGDHTFYSPDKPTNVASLKSAAGPSPLDNQPSSLRSAIGPSPLDTVPQQASMRAAIGASPLDSMQ